MVDDGVPREEIMRDLDRPLTAAERLAICLSLDDPDEFRPDWEDVDAVVEQHRLLLEALEAQEEADKHYHDCDRCGDGWCEEGAELVAWAHDLRVAAIAKAKGEG